MLKQGSAIGETALAVASAPLRGQLICTHYYMGHLCTLFEDTVKTWAFVHIIRMETWSSVSTVTQQ